MFGSHYELRQPVHIPRENWPGIITDHLDLLAEPVTARDLALLEQSARGITALAWADREMVKVLLLGARNAHHKVTVEGQAELLRQVRARVNG
jgi:hypothetical protein